MRTCTLYLKFRWIKAWGVSIGSEHKMRKAANEMVRSNLVTEAAPFSFPCKRNGVEIRAAPLVYVPKLISKVFELLEKNEKYA